MIKAVNSILLALNGGMSDQELAEIKERSIKQQRQVEELRAIVKMTLAR
ncbi:hypothetical protein [Methanocella arvoryzae]|nr:hypothetical protein [Methanocella arvoryzae]